MSDLVTGSLVSSVISDFSDIKANSKIGDEAFEKGFHFAMLISEGKSKGVAYATVYGEDKYASQSGNRLVRTKWIAEIINRLVTGNHIIFADMHYRALEELYNIGMDGDSEKNRVEALKVFVDATKRPQTKVDTQINISLGGEMLDRLEAQLSALASNAQLVLKSGDIIDCEVIQ
jgi:hypothetical protein